MVNETSKLTFFDAAIGRREYAPFLLILDIPLKLERQSL